MGSEIEFPFWSYFSHYQEFQSHLHRGKALANRKQPLKEMVRSFLEYNAKTITIGSKVSLKLLLLLDFEFYFDLFKKS